MTLPSSFIRLIASICLLAICASALAESKESILSRYERESKSAGYSEDFSAERGKQLYFNSTTGHQRTPYCTSCHTKDPRSSGKTRSGKAIKPMAPSVNSERYTNYKKIEKWFRRNCNTVLNRECTPLEKGDFLTFMFQQ
jgi:cytochrome c peroxidase